MGPRRAVEGLEALALRGYQALLVQLAEEVAAHVSRLGGNLGPWSLEAEPSSLALNREELAIKRVVEFVDELQEYVWTRVVWYLCQEVAQRTLEGVIEALERKKAAWTMETNMAEFRLQVSAMMRLTDVMALPGLRALNVEEVPKMMRTGLLRSLSRFRDLRRLNLGSYSGGRVGSLMGEAVTAGLAGMRCLVHFSLQHTCSDHLLGVLAPACCHSLRMLDIQHSGQVTDASVPVLLTLRKLESLAMAKTGLTQGGMSMVVTKLQPVLTSLPACGFLTDLLDWLLAEDSGEGGGWRGKVKRWEERQKLQLGIRQFCWDDSYYFHTTEQMEGVGKMCPDIVELHFMYENQYTCRPEVFHSWRRVQHLDWWGGDWAIDSIDLLLSALGPRLTRLQLHYVDGMDLAALAVLASCCHGLVSLELGALQAGPVYQEEPFLASLRRVEEAELRRQLVPLLDLETVVVGGPCPHQELVTLLGLGLNLRRIRLGSSCQVTDAAVTEVLASNQLQYLEAFEARDAPWLGPDTAAVLLATCPHLVTLLDLATWGGVGEGELARLRVEARRGNMAIDLGEEEVVGERGLTVFQLCRNALTEKYGRVEHWEGEE
jgi:hypothetical protein